MSAVPREIARDLAELRTRFGAVDCELMADDLWLLSLTLRGVPVRIVIDSARFPSDAPPIQVEGGWAHSLVRADGRVDGLQSQKEWNRTFGLAVLVRELNQRFLEEPPAR
jgi:hypothetical protein